MKMRDWWKPRGPGAPFLVGGVAAAFVAVASQSLNWSAGSTIVVGLALAVLLAVVGPPLALLPAEMAEDRRAALADKEALQRALQDALALQNELRAEQATQQARLAAERARFDERVEEERARFEQLLKQERERSERNVWRLQQLVRAGRSMRPRRTELWPAQEPERYGVWRVTERGPEPAEGAEQRRLVAFANADEYLPIGRWWDGAVNAASPATPAHIVISGENNVYRHPVLSHGRNQLALADIADQEEVAN